MVLPPSFMKTDGDGLLRYHDAISRSARRQSEGCARARAGEGMWNATTLNRVWIRSNSPLGSMGVQKLLACKSFVPRESICKFLQVIVSTFHGRKRSTVQACPGPPKLLSHKGCPLPRRTPSLRADLYHTAVFSGRARLIRWDSRGECIASHRSVRRCTFNQKSGLLPNTRARMSAVGAVTALRLLHSSLMCLRCTPIASANAPCVRHIGSMNSSIRISPTLAGLRLAVNTFHLTDNRGRPDRRLPLHLGRHPIGR